MNPADLILPRPAKSFPSDAVVCHLAKINWIEADAEDAFAAKTINDTLCRLGEPPRRIYPGKMNIGTRQRISLSLDPSLGPESYTLNISNESISLVGGDHAGVFYGARSLNQILAVSAALGGADRYVPAGIIQDHPRFPYRGLMLDSARHFQKVDVILALIDEMAKYKLNRFHWHFVDRQSWRLPLKCAPELVKDVPRSRSYVSGSYSFDDLETVRKYAAERFITIVPEIEMPGHSAAVFFTHPELACPREDGQPYESDAWEFCLGNPKVRPFLAEILKETVRLFPDSPLIHIGGDEAGTARWEQCPRCRERLAELKLDSFRDLESRFMHGMEEEVLALGVEPVTWGKHHGGYDLFGKRMIIQNWLAKNPVPLLRQGFRVINSFHEANYFDYPATTAEQPEIRQKIQYEFDPAEGVPSELTGLILGGEGCLWTEQIPQWRVLARARPRLRALSEALWSGAEGKEFEEFRRREAMLMESGLYPYC